jgi:hypothetical protein
MAPSHQDIAAVPSGKLTRRCRRPFAKTRKDAGEKDPLATAQTLERRLSPPRQPRRSAGRAEARIGPKNSFRISGRAS